MQTDAYSATVFEKKPVVYGAHQIKASYTGKNVSRELLENYSRITRELLENKVENFSTQIGLLNPNGLNGLTQMS